MIAFLVTMPISISMPITTGKLKGRPVASSAKIAPPMESGSENRMVMGCRKLPNSSTSTLIDHHDARAHRVAEALEHLAHHLGVAGLLERDAGIVLQRFDFGKLEHLVHRDAERVGADRGRRR